MQPAPQDSRRDRSRNDLPCRRGGGRHHLVVQPAGPVDADVDAPAGPELKDLTGSDVVVDAITGTSAGGINGILLAYALCNEREFSDCNSVWRDAGALMRLIHEPGAPGTKVKSVRDSGFYLNEMQKTLLRMKSIAGLPASQQAASAARQGPGRACGRARTPGVPGEPMIGSGLLENHPGLLQ
ncbi:MAG: hypothetical protein FJW35_04770 [Acidobacteria bacterium]|nr:hypothetical protein [Acidobacteriota bacterium]